MQVPCSGLQLVDTWTHIRQALLNKSSHTVALWIEKVATHQRPVVFADSKLVRHRQPVHNFEVVEIIHMEVKGVVQRHGHVMVNVYDVQRHLHQAAGVLQVVIRLVRVV